MSSNIDHDSYDQNYKRERTKDRNKVVNVEPKLITESNDTGTTIKPKHGFTGQKVGKFYIKTLSEKKRRPSSLNEEDKEILRGMFGSNGEGVRKVDERDYTFDNGVWY